MVAASRIYGTFTYHCSVYRLKKESLCRITCTTNCSLQTLTYFWLKETMINLKISIKHVHYQKEIFDKAFPLVLPQPTSGALVGFAKSEI